VAAGVYGLVILLAVGIDALVAWARGRAGDASSGHESVAGFLNWDLFLAVLAVATLPMRSASFPIATAFNISQAIAGMSEKALIVLPMVLPSSRGRSTSRCEHPGTGERGPWRSRPVGVPIAWRSRCLASGPRSALSTASW
jgi:hypothetical protein